ncbi:MAG: hypothetical protein FK733_00570 [Asgard group archaeon]|nr:hypothetical protein [Asgard group archaeon]
MDKMVLNKSEIKSLIGLLISYIFILIFIVWVILSIIYNRDLISNIIYSLWSLLAFTSFITFAFQITDQSKTKEDESNIDQITPFTTDS